MKKFFASKVSMLYNLGLLVLLFTYPVANLTGMPEPGTNTEMAEKILPNNLNVAAGQNITLYTNDSIKLKTDTMNLAQKIR